MSIYGLTIPFPTTFTAPRFLQVLRGLFARKQAKAAPISAARQQLYDICRRIDVIPYDNKAVQTYKLKTAMKHERFPHSEWNWAPLSAYLDRSFYNSSYLPAIPTAIKNGTIARFNALSDEDKAGTKAYVNYFYKDPFLALIKDEEIVYVEAWECPRFKGKRSW